MMYQFESKQALVEFLASEVIDTSEALEILECKRQNLSYHVARGNISPIKALKKETLYLKSDVLKLHETMQKRKL
ncbi:DNA-binding protein [Paenibacillus sp. UNC451MF]|uniref:DNA-binding protein n=1 Tax=Paenibacillus sp. UNC451MF TaxID=1449063 RepID=UPI000AB79876